MNSKSSAFTKKLILAIVVIFPVLLALNIFVLRDQEIGWGLRFYQYKSKRAASIKSPKVVFLGGSATLFGAKAEYFEQRTGIPAVNMGINGGFTPKGMFEQVWPYLNPGDTLIYLNEYGHVIEFHDEQLPEVSKYDYHLIRLYHPDRLSEVPTPLIMSYALGTNLIDSLLATGVHYLRLGLKGSYEKPIDLNAHGDYPCEGHQKSPTPNLNLKKPLQKIVFLEMLETIQSKANQKGINLLMGFQPLYATEQLATDSFRQQGDALVKTIQNFGISTLLSPSKMVLSPEMFCNSYEHLNTTGGQAMTEMLIEGLTKTGTLKPPVAGAVYSIRQ